MYHLLYGLLSMTVLSIKSYEKKEKEDIVGCRDWNSKCIALERGKKKEKNKRKDRDRKKIEVKSIRPRENEAQNAISRATG